MIYKKIDRHDFMEEFKKYDLDKTFSYSAINALFDFYSEGQEPLELDPVDIACRWEEHGSIEEVVEQFEDNFTGLIDPSDFVDVEDYEDEIMKALANRTTVIQLDDYSGWLIHNYLGA